MIIPINPLTSLMLWIKRNPRRVLRVHLYVQYITFARILHIVQNKTFKRATQQHT